MASPKVIQSGRVAPRRLPASTVWFAMPSNHNPRRRSSLVAIALVPLVWCRPTPSPAQGVRPGDDFFTYANHAWLSATTIPAGKERWGARDEINALTRQRVLRLIDDASGASAGSPGRLVADFRAAWLNERAIEAKGLSPLRPALDSIACLNDKTALAGFLGRWVRADVDPLNWGVYQSAHLLGLSVEPSIHGEKNHVAFLVQGGLGLGDREQYVSVDPAAQLLREKYQQYIARMLALAGFDRSTERAAGVLALEVALAERQASREASANDRRADTVWRRASFGDSAPGMNWTAFFTAAGLGGVAEFGAWQPGAIKGVARLVGTQPLPVWQDYLRFHLLSEHADLLPHDFVEAALGFRTATGSAPPLRAVRALDATQFAMSDAIGRIYAERWFPVDQKARVRLIVTNVATAFGRRVEQATWMSPATKAKAVAKLKVLYVGIGFPERWPEFTGLVVNSTDAIGNLRRVAQWNYRRALSRLGQPVQGCEWLIPPQQPGAILNFQQNAYDFSAALLQAPRFDATASDAATYGAIGAIIGHDIAHFVDKLGADYDVDGAMRGWWTADDQARYAALTTPLVKQFSAYQPLPDLRVDGQRSETENVAELAGLAAAFDAHRLALGTQRSDTAFVHGKDREFFLAFARSWRVQFSEAGMRQFLANDIHAPDMYRVATVRNFDAWYDAFGVVPGDALYLAPASRVRIW